MWDARMGDDAYALADVFGEANANANGGIVRRK